jgi:hypothetical protein
MNAARAITEIARSSPPDLRRGGMLALKLAGELR